MEAWNKPEAQGQAWVEDVNVFYLCLYCPRISEFSGFTPRESQEILFVGRDRTGAAQCKASTLFSVLATEDVTMDISIQIYGITEIIKLNFLCCYMTSKYVLSNIVISSLMYGTLSICDIISTIEFLMNFYLNHCMWLMIVMLECTDLRENVD